MTRVNENRDAQRAEAERAQKTQNQKKQGEKDAFAKMVNQGKAQSTDTKKQVMGQARQQGSATHALLARQGMQARQFSQTLANSGQQSLTNKNALSSERGRDLKETRTSTEEKNSQLDDQRVDKQSDKQEAISRDDRGQQGRGGGGSGGGGGGGSQSRDPQGGSAQDSALKEAPMIQQQQGPQEARAAQHVPRIPPEALEKLVDKVMVGITAEGLNVFHIELKDGILGGSSVQITAQDGKISAKFSTGDEQVKRLLKASEGELARTFARKGMTLERLEVESY